MSIIQLGAGGDWPSTPATDANASSLVLALPFNSSYGVRDQSAKIRGSGSSYKTNSYSGSFDSTSSKFYGSSLLLGNSDTSTRKLYTPSLSAFGASNFCIETYLFVPALETGQFTILYAHDGTNAGLQFLLLGTSQSPAGGLYFSGGGGGDIAQTNANSLPLNQWVHIAATRASTTLRLFINGVNSVTFGGTSTLNFSGSFEASTNGTSTQYSNVRFQDYRIYQGAAKYTANFTPPGAMFV